MAVVGRVDDGAGGPVELRDGEVGRPAQGALEGVLEDEVHGVGSGGDVQGIVGAHRDRGRLVHVVPPEVGGVLEPRVHDEGERRVEGPDLDAHAPAPRGDESRRHGPAPPRRGLVRDGPRLAEDAPLHPEEQVPGGVHPDLPRPLELQGEAAPVGAGRAQDLVLEGAAGPVPAEVRSAPCPAGEDAAEVGDSPPPPSRVVPEEVVAPTGESPLAGERRRRLWAREPHPQHAPLPAGDHRSAVREEQREPAAPRQEPDRRVGLPRVGLEGDRDGGPRRGRCGPGLLPAEGRARRAGGGGWERRQDDRGDGEREAAASPPRHRSIVAGPAAPGLPGVGGIPALLPAPGEEAPDPRQLPGAGERPQARVEDLPGAVAASLGDVSPRPDHPLLLGLRRVRRVERVEGGDDPRTLLHLEADARRDTDRRREILRGAGPARRRRLRGLRA